MAYETLATKGGEQSLAPLVEKSELLTRRRGHVVATDKLSVPYNEFGIPQPQEFIRQVLGSLATKHIWTGQHDVHHVAWPEITYKQLNALSESHVGSMYRGAAALKVRMPRQLHNYIHAISSPPPIPDLDTMRQWAIEQRQVDRLFDTVRLENMSDFDMSEEQREKYRFSNYRKKLDHMEDGYLGLMPEKEYLAALDIHDARRTLRALARVRGISNARTSQRQFFSQPILQMAS